MTNRIQKLADQCWSHYINGVLIDGHLHFDHQKFAELLIAECIEVMYNQEKLPEGFNYAKGVSVHEVAIRQHFGVKRIISEDIK